MNKKPTTPNKEQKLHNALSAIVITIRDLMQIIDELNHIIKKSEEILTSTPD